MQIFGQELKKSEILAKIGDISQLGGIKLYELVNGVGKGIRAADIRTASGIDLTVLIDRGMDISSLYYKGIPFAFKSSTKETSVAYYDSTGMEWLRTFFGGLLTTCGLANVGDPSTDEGENFGLHGRISNIQAELITASSRWEKDDFLIEIIGRVRHSKFFGENLELERKITCSLFSTKIIIEDRIENHGFKTTPLMILYHLNIGYPVLDKDTVLIESGAEVTPRDEESEKGLSQYNCFFEPSTDFRDQVFFHDIKPDKNGFCHAAMINEKYDNNKGIGIAFKFKKDNLPYLVQWKHATTREYVCGIEPANCYVLGRATEKKQGRLKYIEPDEIKNYYVELNILKSNSDISIFKNTLIK